MKNMTPFFVIGTVGMAVTSVLHMVMVVLIDLPGHSAFFALYSVFLSFLIIGFAQLRRLKAVKQRS